MLLSLKGEVEAMSGRLVEYDGLYVYGRLDALQHKGLCSYSYRENLTLPLVHTVLQPKPRKT